MRFQDAERDARTVVYAGIQADPLVARLAALVADAGYGQRLMARAVMNGESGDPATWRTIFPTVLGPDAPERERAEEILAASLEVAARGEQVGSQVRGAFVEELAQQLVRPPAWEPRAGSAVRRSDASSSTASPPRSTRTTSPSRSPAGRKPGTASGALAGSTPTS